MTNTFNDKEGRYRMSIETIIMTPLAIYLE